MPVDPIFAVPKRRELSSAGSEHPDSHRKGYWIKEYNKKGEFSSAGSEHLPYKQRVTGSNPVTPTERKPDRNVRFFYLTSIMHFVYILYSLTRDKYYVGSCENVDKRLIKHNTNHSGFTGKTLDWVVKWTEEHISKTDALNREKQIKAWKSRIIIEKLINDI